MTDGITDFLDDNRSAAMSAGSTIASIGVDAGAKGLGKWVSPAVWTLTGEAPSKVDGGLWAIGLIPGFGIAAAGTSFIKGMVDDDVRRRLEGVKACEPAEKRPFIRPAVDYSMWAGEGINAQTIASCGGTAWEHPNGLWVYLADARGVPVCDYRPAIARTIYRPYLPLSPAGRGRVKWTVVRGGQ